MENEIVNLKVTEKDLCLKCNKELKTKSLGSDSFFGSLGGTGAFYCENQDCEFIGVLTLARKKHTEKKEPPQSNASTSPEASAPKH